MKIAQKKKEMEAAANMNPADVPPDMCPVHKRKLEVICYDCRIRICTN